MLFKSYSEQQDNMETIESCLDNIKEQEYLENDVINMNWNSLLEANDFFSKYVKQETFEDYLQKFTIKIDECVEQEVKESEHVISPLLRNLANSLTDYQVIDLIAKKLIKKHE